MPKNPWDGTKRRKRVAQGLRNRPEGSKAFTKAPRHDVDDEAGPASADAPCASASDCIHTDPVVEDQLDEDWRRPWLGESTHSEWFGCTEQEDLYDSASDFEKEDEEEEEVVMVEEEEGEDGELQMSERLAKIAEGEKAARDVIWGARKQEWGDDFFGTFMDVAAVAIESQDRSDRDRLLAKKRQQRLRARLKSDELRRGAGGSKKGGLLSYGFTKTNQPPEAAAAARQVSTCTYVNCAYIEYIRVLVQPP